MKKYFFFIGVITIIGFVAIFIAYIAYLIAIYSNTNAYPSAYEIVILITFAIVGPSLGLLFISHSKLLDARARPSTYSKPTTTTSTSTTNSADKAFFSFYSGEYIVAGLSFEKDGVSIPSGCVGKILGTNKTNKTIKVEFYPSDKDEPQTVIVTANQIKKRF